MIITFFPVSISFLSTGCWCLRGRFIFFLFFYFFLIPYSLHIEFSAFSFIWRNLKGILNEIQIWSIYKNIEKLQKMTMEKTKGTLSCSHLFSIIVGIIFTLDSLLHQPMVRLYEQRMQCFHSRCSGQKPIHYLLGLAQDKR